MAKEIIVGIDLGTTNSVISYMQADGKVKVIPNPEGTNTTPSVVGFKASGEEIVGRVVGKVTNGSIILCHNNSDHILDALPTILDELTAKGYRFVTMSELLYSENYTIDAQGVQHKN